MRKFCLVIYVLLTIGLVAADSSMALLGKIGDELNKVENALVKSLLEQKVKEVFSEKDEAKKQVELEKILLKLRQMNQKKPEHAAVAIDIAKEIALQVG